MARRWLVTPRARCSGAARLARRGPPSRPTGSILMSRTPSPAAWPPFQPYGVDPDVSDPIARALTGLLDEVATLRARVSELEAERARPAAPIEAPAPAPAPRRRRVAGANP